VPERAVRELLALQSSDWAFLVTRDTAGRYPRERFEGHLAQLRAALADPDAEPALRNLAPHLAAGALLEP
jgi:1,4-alpha-glucan branching enzyme